MPCDELKIDLPPAEDAALRFIGRIRTPWAQRADCPKQGDPEGPECRLVLDPEWEPALRNLDEAKALEVLYWLDQSERNLLTQNRRGTGPIRGTFALRSPARPNPIGLSRVKLVRVTGPEVVVRGLDCVDGTPLLDIKPARCPRTGAA